MFTYAAPTSVEQVVDALSEWGSRARILAGGQTLIPLIHSGRLNPDHLIDINGVRSLDFIHQNGDLSLGACCRQHDLEAFLHTRKRCALIAEALPLIADREIRNRGTVCGSLAAALPGAVLPAVALACNAKMRIQNKDGARELCATDFYRDNGSVALAPDEFLTGVVFPECDLYRSAIEEVRYTQLSFPACGAAVLVDSHDGLCSSVRIAVFGQGFPARRMGQAELLVKGERLTPQLLDEVAVRIRKQVRAHSVPGIPEEYARHVAGSLAARAFKRAVELSQPLTTQVN